MSNPVAVQQAVACIKGLLPEHPDEPPATVLSRGDSPVMRSLKNGLVVCYLVDEGDRFNYVQYRDLDEHRITPDQLSALGLGNLLTLAATKTRVQPYGSINAVFLDGNFEASLILVNQLWESGFRQFVKGHYAVAIPARDILAFGDASSATVIQELQGVIDRVMPGANHTVSDRIYVREGDTWRQRPL